MLKLNLTKLFLMYLYIFFQSMCELLAEESSLWWMLALLCGSDHDETPAKNAYVRHGGRKSTADERQRIEDDERERTRSGGLASVVPSEKRDDAGGQLVSVTGQKSGRSFEYVTNILYDEYGQRSSISYGNGTSTKYKYDPARRWLDSILTINKYGEMYQNIAYKFDDVGNVSAYTNDCLDNRKGNYKTAQKYEYDALYQLVKASGETTYNPYRSMNPEHVSSYTQEFAFDSLGLGNMTSKVSSASVRPSGARLGDDLNYSFSYEYDTNFAHRLKRAGNRWYKYDSNGNVIFEKDLPEGMTLEDDENTVVMSRVQTLRENVYAIDEGWGLFATDSASAGSSRASKKNGGRTYTWNERNQLVSTVDDSRSTSYVYDYNGVRTNKYSRGTETLYFNQFYSVRYDNGVGYGNGQMVKHIYLGDTRIVTKLGSLKNDSYSEEYHKQYFYHSDHLGSASLISDFEGREYQRIEYTPYGETWVEKSSNTGMEYLPYKFTGKERDEETGLYYYGARYLDPQYSRWLSADPALGEYVPQVGGDNSKLPNGGVHNHVNLSLYHYSNNNPITYKDPDGRFCVSYYYDAEYGYKKYGMFTYHDRSKIETAMYYGVYQGVMNFVPFGGYLTNMLQLTENALCFITGTDWRMVYNSDCAGFDLFSISVDVLSTFVPATKNSQLLKTVSDYCTASSLVSAYNSKQQDAIISDFLNAQEINLFSGILNDSDAICVAHGYAKAALDYEQLGLKDKGISKAQWGRTIKEYLWTGRKNDMYKSVYEE